MQAKRSPVAVVCALSLFSVVACSGQSSSDGPSTVDSSPKTTTGPYPNGSSDGGASRSDGGALPSNPGPDGGRDGGASSCVPPKTVTVQYEAPAAARAFGANACTEAKVNEFLKTCIEGDNATNCNAWLKANGACATCLATPPDKAPTGAFLLDASGQSRPWPNQEGCLSNVQPGCGPKWGSLIACEYTACPKAACETEPATTIDKCFSDAVTGPCASQLQATKTACSTALPENKQGPGAVCITLQTEGDFRAFAMKFCGP